MSVLSSPHFHDEAKAYEYLAEIVWANGVTCPHCGVVDSPTTHARQQYVDPIDRTIHTNTVEGAFSIPKSRNLISLTQPASFMA